MATAETIQGGGTPTDDDDEQSRPLLVEEGPVGDGDDDGEQGQRSWSSSQQHNGAAKLAEYLPATEQLSVVHRVLRGLYGQLPAADVPRIVWVSLDTEW